MSIKVLLEDDGTVRLTMGDGMPLTPAQVKRIREQEGESIAEMLDRACERWNQGIDELLTLHRTTPSPESHAPVFQEEAFREPEPTARRPRRLGLLGRMFRKRRERIAEENRQAASEHENQLAAWGQRAGQHQVAQAHLRWVFDVGRYQDLPAMHEYLERALSSIAWPRETTVSAEIEPGPVVWLDVDLPELEHMPTHSATVATRGLKVSINGRRSPRSSAGPTT